MGKKESRETEWITRVKGVEMKKVGWINECKRLKGVEMKKAGLINEYKNG